MSSRLYRGRPAGRHFLLCISIGLAGCASSHRPGSAVSSLQNHGKGAAIPKPAPADSTQNKPEWDTCSTPAELLAKQTAQFAKHVATDSTPDDVVEPLPKPARYVEPPEKPSRINVPVSPTPSPSAVPVEGSPVGPPPGVISTDSHTSAPADGPKIMPESADFAGSDSVSKDPLGTRLRKRVLQDPHDIANQLDLQLYGMLNDDPAPELAEMTELPGDDRELVAALIDGLSNFRSTVREDSRMLQSRKIQPLLEMADRLRSQAYLTVNNLTLCRRVDGFGKYEPISPLRFPAMQENPAIVYCEVENFLPKKVGEMWETRLTEQVTVFTDTGVLAWSDEKRDVRDSCRNRRHDFFAYNIIKLPPSLTVGRYVLHVSVEDKNADRVFEPSLAFEIVGK